MRLGHSDIENEAEAPPEDRRAREVGGDYYDFLEFPNGALGVAIGDVSGKGIPAPLLMASLQASLRAQTLSGCDSLERLMGNVNQLVYAGCVSLHYRISAVASVSYQAEADKHDQKKPRLGIPNPDASHIESEQ